MTSSKPYLIRALYEWMADNAFTPYLLVKANTPDCMVPEEFVQNGEIVLDISMDATQNLTLGNEAVEFKARFSGKVRNLYIPINAVGAIYSQENGQGMAFPDEELSGELPKHAPPKKGKPNLKVESSDDESSDNKSTEQKTNSPKGKPDLKIVE